MMLPITPETKVGALLDAYPGIEDVLIAWVPAFARLKNPVLRRTVAKVATLEQAARIGGVGVRELVRKLRQASGQGDLEVLPGAEHAASAGEAPDWLREDRVRRHIDADTMLKTGEHPIGKVRQFVANSEPGDILRLTSSFYPAPLIDAMLRSGLAVYSEKSGPGGHVTYFSRQPACHLIRE